MSFESHNTSNAYKVNKEEYDKNYLRIFNKEEYNKLYGEDELDTRDD